MNSVAAIRLAVDILTDHFGTAVGRVGGVLLERGPLSLQDILRFAKVGAGIAEEPLTFLQVRNSLLALLQHGVVAARPHQRVAGSDLARSLLQVYSIDVEEVLARLRFPHFLEHAQWTLGELAYELLFSVLRYGRVSAALACSEARRALRGASAEDCAAELRRLVQQRLLRVVEPFSSTGAASPSSSSAAAPRAAAGPSAAPAAPEGDAAPLQDAPPAEEGEGGEGEEEVGAGLQGRGRKRPREGEGGDSLVPAPQQRQDAGSARSREAVYCYDRSNLNLCIWKNLLCRVVAERVNNHAAQVLAALLTAVRPGRGSEGDEGELDVEVGFMQFLEIEEKMKELGFHQPGRDPHREGEKLRKVLDLLSAHKDGLVRKRVRTSGEGTQVMIPEGPQKGKWVRCTVTGSGTKPGTKNVRLAEPEIMGEFSNVPLQAMRRTDNQIVEWCMEWKGARRLLRGSATSQLIRDQFGIIGLRIFNLLNEKSPQQKMEDKDIFSTCMVPPSEGREVLNEMVRRFIICWQEVPKGANAPLSASYWLYYVDRQRVQHTLLQNVMQAALNLRIRFRTESAKVVPLEARQDSLTARERSELKAGRRTEDVLERSFLVLDAAILVFRCF